MIPETDYLRHYGIFGWCAHGCLGGVYRWCEDNNWHDPIHYVFEAGTEGAEQFNRTMNILYKNDEAREKNRIAGWSFESKATMPLQAADILAYEFYKFIHNELIEGKKRPIRLSARDLFRPQEMKFLKHFGKSDFELFIEEWKQEALTESNIS